MGKEEQMVAAANELCRVANERFGLELALKCVLQGKLSLGGGIAERLVELAKDRDIDAFLYELWRPKTSHGERNLLIDQHIDS